MVAMVRKTGIQAVGDAPWGTHFCQFFQSKQDLLEILVPYFKAGLENNEFCIWITAQPLEAEEARQAMSDAVPGFADYVAKGQIEIVRYNDWYGDKGKLDGERLVGGLRDRVVAALGSGYDGVRTNGNLSPLGVVDWGSFSDYEAQVDIAVRGNRLISMCSYRLDRWNAVEAMDLIRHHEFALIKRDGTWTRIEDTAYKATQQALLESQQRYQSLFDNMTEGAALHEIIFDQNGAACDYRFLEVNNAFGTLTGLLPGAVRGKTVRDVLPAIELHWIERYAHVASTGEPALFEDYSAPLDKWYQVYAYSPAAGQFATFFRDITKRKKAEEALRQAHDELEARVRERSQALQEANRALQAEIAERRQAEVALMAERQQFIDVLDTLPAYLILLSPDYHVPFANRFFRERFGDSHGQRCFEYLFGRSEPCDKCETYKVLKTMSPLEWEWTGPDGRDYYIHDYPFKDTNGTTVIMETGIDITEQKQAQLALRKAHDELEKRVQERTAELAEANRELESFSYTVSHDLRAPLRAMDGYSKALLEDYAEKLDDQGKAWLDNIRASSQMMGQLIDDVLGLSRVVRTELKVQRVDLSDAAAAIAERLKSSDPGRKVEFTIAPGCEAWGDANLLRLVLENLLGNAFKFTARCETARIEFAMIERNGRRACFVRDNGIGLDMRYIDKLFKPFQRLQSDKDFPGTGIGLVTVQRIIKRHGGEVWAEGEVGKGATFYFTLEQGKV